MCQTEGVMGLFPLYIRAIFRDGKFVPEQPCVIPNNAQVELTVTSRSDQHPIDPAARAQEMADIVAAMMNNPLPADAPRFTRDELHERS